MAGWPLPAALMALLPEAAALRDEPIDGLDAWQAAMAGRFEPWDGPAALVFSDGRQVGALLDRNGLRPAAWEIRRDGLVVLASEAGLLPAGPGEVVRRGRLGPGELLVVDPARGGLLEDRAAKAAAIAALPAVRPPGRLVRGVDRSTARTAAPASAPADPLGAERDRRRRLAAWASMPSSSG